MSTTAAVLGLHQQDQSILMAECPGALVRVEGGKVAKVSGAKPSEWALVLLAQVAQTLGIKDGELSMPSIEEFTTARQSLAARLAADEAMLQVNPFARGKHYNITKQVELRRDRPDLAQRLQAAAK